MGLFIFSVEIVSRLYVGTYNMEHFTE